MRAISTGLLALLLVPTSAGQSATRPPMADVTGGSSSSALAAWATPTDSVRAEALLSPAEIRRPLERYLAHYSTDRLLVSRISRAVLRESRRQQVPPSLIAAVLVTENTTLTPEARSSVGAEGLMQVMPMHAGAELCRSSDLVDVDSNICHGTLILARNLRRTVTNFTAADMDFIRHYRPRNNVVERPTEKGGRRIILTGHHELMFPLLVAAIREARARSPRAPKKRR